MGSSAGPILVTGGPGSNGGPLCVDMPFDQWRDQELGKRGLSEHLFEHLVTMARLHAANCYHRLTRDVETITGTPTTTIRDFVAQHEALFDTRDVRRDSSAPAAWSPGLSRRPRS
jgi:hypothetical protein